MVVNKPNKSRSINSVSSQQRGFSLSSNQISLLRMFENKKNFEIIADIFLVSVVAAMFQLESFGWCSIITILAIYISNLTLM